MTVLLTPTTAHAQDITTGLLGHWTLDETEGTDIIDATGNGHDGTLGNGMDAGNDSVPGRIGNALQFQGPTTNYELTIPDDPVLRPNEFTMAAWFKVDAFTAQGAQKIFYKPGSTSANHFGFDVNQPENSLRCSIRNTGIAESASDLIVPGIWYHGACVFDTVANEVRGYLNGELVAGPVSQAAVGDTTGEDIAIGWRNGNPDDYFNGAIDDVRFYNRPLTADDVLALYEMELLDICANEIDAGKIIYDVNYRVMKYCDGAAWQSMGKEASVLHGQKTRGEDYTPNAVEFDGATYLTTALASAWLGGQQLTGSMWIRLHDVSGTMQIFQPFNDADMGCRFNTVGDVFQCIFENDSAIDIIDFDSNTTLVADTWYHVLFSFDTSSALNRHLYINGVADAATWNTYTVDESIDDRVFGSRTIGARNSGASLLWDGDMADIWIDNTYIDLSIQANREKFIKDGRAVNLGADGSRPTGVVPDIFLSGDTADWHTNKGGGGGFDENGALTDAASAPAGTTAEKLVGWWRLDETSGTTVVDSSDEGNNGSMAGTFDASTATTTGTVNNAFTFNGTDDNVEISGDVLDNMPEQTVCAWIYQTATAGSWAIVAGKTSNGYNGWNLYTHRTNGALGFYNTNNRYQTSAGVITNNQWHHICGSTDGGTSGDSIQLYLDGTLVAGGESCSGGCPAGDDSPYNVTIGATDSPTLLFQGQIDDVRVYNHILSAEEIEELYNASSDIYNISAIDFDGTDALTSNTATGPSSSTSWSGSFWVQHDGTNGIVLYDKRQSGADDLRVDIDWNGNDSLNFRADNSSSTPVLDINSDPIPIGGWHHILYSFDLSNPVNRHIYINDVSALATVNVYNTAETMDFSGIYEGISGTGHTGGARGIQDLADFWLDYDTYIDFSIEANRRKFIDANGGAVYLGENGQIPTGSQPDTFLSGDIDTWENNKGTGDGFVEVGTITAASNSPPTSSLRPRYCTNPAQPEGTLVYNANEDVMQYCDAYRWIPLGPQGDGGSGCSNPSGVAGSLIFNSTFNTLQYCEGDEWVGIGADPTPSLLALGLIGHWRLDETSGTFVADSSGSGNNGTHTNATPAWQPSGGQVSGALTFTPSTDLVDVGNWEITGGTGLTLSAWVNKDIIDAEDRRIISKSDGSGMGSHKWALLTNGGASISLRLTTVNGFEDNGISTPNDIFYDKWSLVSVTYEASTGNIVYYVNGQQYGTDVHSLGGAIDTTSGDPIAIGNNPAIAGAGITRSWSGELDDVRVYNRPLSAGEIMQLYQTTGNIDSTDIGMIAHWTMDDTGTQTLADSAGNNDGTYYASGSASNVNSVAGIIDNAISVDGIDQHVRIADSPVFDTIKTNMTVSAWVNKQSPVASGFGAIMTRAIGGGNSDLWGIFYDNAATNRYYAGFETDLADDIIRVNPSDSNRDIGRWVLVTLVYDGTDFVLYNNGYPMGSFNSPGGTFQDEDNIITIGGATNDGESTYDEFIDAYIDDVRLYNRSLSMVEVRTLYRNAIPNTTCSGMGTAHWEDPATGHCYVYDNTVTAVSWDDAMVACNSLGGYLANMNSATENTNVITNLGIATEVYIGGRDSDDAGDWKWYQGEDNPLTSFWAGDVGGSPVGSTYASWNTGQPSSATEDCTATGWDTGDRTLWHDVGCSSDRPFICEIPDD